MSIDDNAAIIEPQKGKREETLPSRALLIFTPQDVDVLVRCFSEPPRRVSRVFLVDVYRGMFDETPLTLAGPMMGAPQTIMALEKLVALGVRKVIALGWCGSLQSHVKIGDIVFPTGAISEEGTSAHYPIKSNRPGPSPELLGTLRKAVGTDTESLHEGLVWSIDAPYRETFGKVMAYQKQGVLGVDMETSALLTVAAYRGIQLAVVLIVSDDLSRLKWTHGFREPRFQQARQSAAARTLEAICLAAGSLD